MEQRILVSVIVPVYNVERYLSRCVDSILNQTYGNLEIILVNDGSRDSSGELCDNYARRDPRIRVIHKENGGLSSARNAGIDIAAGTYLEFVDSDDWIEPDAVETMLSLALDCGVELVCGGRWDVDGETGEKTQGLCPPRQEVISGETLVGRIFLWDQCDSSACDKLFHCRLFRECRFPVGVIVEDVPVMYLMVLDAGKAAMCPKPIYNYFHRPGSITTASISEKTFHFARHTAVIHPYIREHCPNIEPQARYLRVRSLVYSVQAVDIADRESARRFRRQGRDARRELRKHLGFVLKCPWFSRRKKLEILLMVFGLYRTFRGIYHRVR